MRMCIYIYVSIARQNVKKLSLKIDGECVIVIKKEKKVTHTHKSF